ncbi:hypothetical protein MMC28_009816 [Mycoblastus sanguinarius]|nr:hypothetical protein [Mycoblastus sanguinarius]
MEDACTALLLSQLPNLQELQVEVTSRPAPKCTWRLFEEAGQNLELGVLNSLKRLSIYSEDVKYGHDMSPILSLYWLPSLETYNATYCQWGNTYLSDYAPAMPSMTSLDFDLCAFTAKAMELVLKHCKGLKIFRFSYYPLYMFDGQFTAADIVLLLRRYHLSTIERLRIDLDDGGSESESLKTIQLQEPLRLDQIMAGSLRDFSNLTFLSIGQQSLLGLLYLDERYRSDDEEQQWNTDVKLGDILPPSLKALIILYCDARIYRYLIEMASVRKERLPNLEWVGIGMAYSFCTEATFNLQGIMVIFSLHPPRD